MPKFDGWSLDDRNPEVIKSFMPQWEWLYHHYFRVQTDGWHHVPSSGKALVVGSHNGGLAAPDMFMFMYDWFRRFGYERLSYGLMHPNVWKVFPDQAKLSVQCGAIVAHPKMAFAALERDAMLTVYPGGAYDVFRPHSMRDKIYFAGNKAFIKVALIAEVPIIPIISHGAHDTIIVLGEFYEQARQLHESLGIPWLCGVDPVVFPIYLGLPWGIGLGPLPNIPLPAQIHTRVCQPIVFEKYGRKASKDRDYVDACYNQVLGQMQQSLDQLVREHR